VDQIMDNLLATGKTKPMLIVMDNLNAVKPGEDGTIYNPVILFNHGDQIGEHHLGERSAQVKRLHRGAKTAPWRVCRWGDSKRSTRVWSISTSLPTWGASAATAAGSAAARLTSRQFAVGPV
jgi:hypothetical protein